MNLKEFDIAMENMLINQKDYVQNFDKWKPGPHNILYVTGFSGSGKSTLTQEYAKKYNAIPIELDMFEYGEDFSGIGIVQKCKDAIPEYKEAVDSKWKNPDGSRIDHDTVIKISHKAAKYALNLCKNDSDRLYIVEGLQLFLFTRYDPKMFISEPLIIKGTSALVSEFRSIKRAFKLNEKRKNKKRKIDIVKGHLKSHLPMNMKHDKILKSFKGNIQP